MALSTAVIALLISTMGSVPAMAEPVTANLPTVNITLPPGVTQSALDSSKDTVRLPTTIAIEDPAGTHSLGGVAGEIKGRGNYTWNLAKKPYQIKLPDAAGLLGMAPAKTWILLANHADASLMRNKLAYDLAADIGLPYSPESRWVDVRINGQYRGNYLLSEKTEVKTNRVELVHPQGILAELDNNYGTAEDHYFYTSTSKTLFTLKDAKSSLPDLPTPLPPDTQDGWNDMRDTLNQLDSLLYAPTFDWAAISALIDVDSFVKYYFIFEVAENPEITQSSVFFYKDGPDDKLHAGPVWDFDSSLGQYNKSESYGADTLSEYVKNAQLLRNKGNGWFTRLFMNAEFVERANQLWDGGIAAEVNALPAKIDLHNQTVTASAIKNFARWPILGGPTLLISTQGHTYATTFQGEVAYLKTWVSRRNAHLQKAYGEVPILSYSGHVQRVGWMPAVKTGQVAGTVGRSLRLETLRLGVVEPTPAGSIEARAHIQSIGWTGWTSTSQIGTVGRSLRLEAVQFRLTGDLATRYDVSYRAHVQGIGWQSWKLNAVTAGTTGQAKRIEALQVRLLLKNPPTRTAAP